MTTTGNFITGYTSGADPNELFLKWALLFLVGEVFFHTDILRIVGNLLLDWADFLTRILEIIVTIAILPFALLYAVGWVLFEVLLPNMFEVLLLLFAVLCRWIFAIIKLIIGHPLESLSLYLFLGLFLPIRHTNTTYVCASRYDVPVCILACMLYRNYRRAA